MIVTGDQVALNHWLRQRISIVYTPGMQCVGNVLGGKLRGVAGYDNYNGASIMMHIAGEGNWLTKRMLNAMFDYPFNVCKANVIMALIASDNAKSLNLAERLGFSIKVTLEGGHPNGALYILAMRRNECRFIDTSRMLHPQLALVH